MSQPVMALEVKKAQGAFAVPANSPATHALPAIESSTAPLTQPGAASHRSQEQVAAQGPPASASTAPAKQLSLQERSHGRLPTLGTPPSPAQKSRVGVMIGSEPNVAVESNAMPAHHPTQSQDLKRQTSNPYAPTAAHETLNAAGDDAPAAVHDGSPTKGVSKASPSIDPEVLTALRSAPLSDKMAMCDALGDAMDPTSATMKFINRLASSKTSVEEAAFHFKMVRRLIIAGHMERAMEWAEESVKNAE